MSKGGGGTGLSSMMAANIKDAEFAHSAALTREQSLMGVLNEACKTTIALNGGAAIAMGALLQAILDRAGMRPIREALLWAIALAAVGMLLGASTFMLRFFALRRREDGSAFGNEWGRAAFWVGIASMVAFVVSVAIPLITAFIKL